MSEDMQCFLAFVSWTIFCLATGYTYHHMNTRKDWKQ
jgi:hypothetical protein